MLCFVAKVHSITVISIVNSYYFITSKHDKLPKSLSSLKIQTLSIATMICNSITSAWTKYAIGPLVVSTYDHSPLQMKHSVLLLKSSCSNECYEINGYYRVIFVFFGRCSCHTHALLLRTQSFILLMASTTEKLYNLFNQLIYIGVFHMTSY